MRKTIPLSNGWLLNMARTHGNGELYGFTKDELPKRIPTQTRDWLPVSVPGSVQRALFENGELPDPYVADNLDHWRWVEDREWWYRTHFSLTEHDVSGKHIHLYFESLDTCATVYLNGEEIAHHQNMFRPLELDISHCVRYDRDNVLAVRFSPVHLCSPAHPGDGTSGFTDPHRVHTRKAQFSFGWDIAPRLMTIGIPGTVALHILDDVRIVSAATRTVKMDDAGADIELIVEIENLSDTARDITLHADVHHVRKDITRSLADGITTVTLPIRLDGVSAWYPRGYGDPVLYDASLELSLNTHRADSKTWRFGCRTVSLVRESQADGGESFYFKINGKRVFIKGLNYTPGDAMITRIDDARTRELVDLAYDCNVNLLRVWGGGLYEKDLFYELCDEKGILVWQDFMYACGIYPEHDAFLDEAKWEAEYQLRRLRPHPSLMILAGDNENDAFYYYADRRDFTESKLTRGVLKRTSDTLCPDIPYIPSSPISYTSDDPLNDKEGDNHLWNHTAAHTAEPYASDNSRFMSEMGRLSLPDMRVIEAFLPDSERLPLTGRLWRYHAADTDRVGFGDRMDDLMTCLANSGYNTSGTIEELVNATQQLQADALTRWYKKYRKSSVCGGVIFWNLCDCWPQMSDAIVAYPNIKKKAWYALRDAFADDIPD